MSEKKRKRKMLEIIMQGRRQWPRKGDEMHRTLRHLLDSNGRR